MDISSKLQVILGKEGMFIIPFKSPTLPYFSKMSLERQQQVVAQLQTLLDLSLSLQREELKVTEPVNLMRIFLKIFNLTASPEVLNSITRNDVVEIYDADSRLNIASLNFFDFCTLSLEEIFCRPWDEIWLREGETHTQIFELCRTILSGETKEPIDMSHIGVHTVREAAATDRYAVIQPRTLAPVFAGEKLYGFMSVNRVVKVHPKNVLRMHD